MSLISRMERTMMLQKRRSKLRPMFLGRKPRSRVISSLNCVRCERTTHHSFVISYRERRLELIMLKGDRYKREGPNYDELKEAIDSMCQDLSRT